MTLFIHHLETPFQRPPARSSRYHRCRSKAGKVYATFHLRRLPLEDTDDWTTFPFALLILAPVAAQERAAPADIVMRGGKVITVGAEDRIVEAIAIRRNRILAVGSNREMERWIGSKTEVFDLEGRAVVPGFIDAHNHVEHTARFRHFLLNIHSPPLESSGEVLARVAERVAEVPVGTWIVGQGTYGQPMPSREELDRVAPDHPVVLRWSMHLQVANSKALEVSDIGSDTPDPPGGRVDRDGDGNPTGIFREAFDLFAIPPYPHDELREAIRDTLTEIFLKQGVTTVYALPATASGVRAYQELREQGELPVRVHLNFTIAPGHQPLAELRSLLKLGIRTGLGDDWLKVGAIKVFVDGSGQAAVMYRRPEGEKNFGLTRSPEQLKREVTDAHRAGWQLWLHAIGDKAQDIALDAYEAALEAHPRKDHRHRIEHMGNVLYEEDALARAKRLGVIPVPTVAFLWSNTSPPAEETRYSLATLLKLGFQPPGNADSAGTQTFSINPMFSLTRAVTRTSRTGVSISPEEAVSPMDVIRMHTAFAAYAGFEDTRIGSLAAGKLADLVVLSEDPLAVASGRFMKIRVDLTMIDGKVRYQRSGAEVPTGATSEIVKTSTPSPSLVRAAGAGLEAGSFG
ncbi:MAG: amidohydrolase [Nitrospiraceae bacterium]